MHVRLNTATTVHAASADGAYAACAWYGSAGPRKRVHATSDPITCKKCIKAQERSEELDRLANTPVAPQLTVEDFYSADPVGDALDAPGGTDRERRLLALAEYQRQQEAQIELDERAQIELEAAHRQEQIADVARFYGDDAAQLVSDGWTVDSAIAHTTGTCDRELCTAHDELHDAHRALRVVFPDLS